VTGRRLGILGGVAALLGLGALLALVPSTAGPPGPEPGRTLYAEHCQSCHGADGRGGSWRAWLLLLRPGDLTARQASRLSDAALFGLIRHGGATFGKPGMPSFGFVLSDEEIHAVIAYVRVFRAGADSRPPAR
jgi:mono/diheme cytochrome c family protein